MSVCGRRYPGRLEKNDRQSSITSVMEVPFSRDFLFASLTSRLIHDLDIFISVDKKLKKDAIPQLPLLTPAEFLKEIRD